MKNQSRSWVGNVCREIARMRCELQEARREIAYLRAQLGSGSAGGLPAPDLRALRRQVSFHCHPDRGGDDEVMRRVNALFDALERTDTVKDAA